MTSAWVLTEGAAGMVNQCLAITDALGIEPAIKRAVPAGLWARLPAWLALPPLNALTDESDPLGPPFPDLLIACGRKSIGLALRIRRASRGRCFTVYVQDPRLDPARFDLVIAPRHDAARGDNVVLTRGAPSRVTPARLDEAKLRFGTLLAALPRPLVAVLLGGRTRHHPFSPPEAKALGERLAALARSEGAGLAVTASRRTPPESLQAFRAGLGATPHHLYDGTGENPYFGLLALADAIVVTADSVNMVSDAASTGRPVLVARLEGRPSRRFVRFLDALEKDGTIRRFEGRLERYEYAPLADAASAAAELGRRWAAHRSR
ncbi:MAG: mitochondrial fission ELM1 family protein [Alphaproteobacteria bacterium]